jgi:hypothetical protein
VPVRGRSGKVGAPFASRGGRSGAHGGWDLIVLGRMTTVARETSLLPGMRGDLRGGIVPLFLGMEGWF